MSLLGQASSEYCRNGRSVKKLIHTDFEQTKKNPAFWTGFNCVTGTATHGVLWVSLIKEIR